MSADWRILRNKKTGEIILGRARMCRSFWCHLRGLQFVSHLPEDEGLLFVTHVESRANTTIHMFFMLFSISVIWMDSSGKVVDLCTAKPWRPAYAPRVPAQYYLEANTALLNKVQIGDVLQFDEAAV
jgi:uncharacterized membrane protein (UPF0127 family)